MKDPATNTETTPLKLNPLWGLLVLFSMGFPLFFIFLDTPEPPPVIERAPEFSLINQNEVEITNADFEGRVTLVNFIFTRCRDVCPNLTTKLMHVKSELGDRSDIQYLTITVDPEYDSPTILQKYVERFEIESENWHFLTGSYEEIQQLIGGFQLALQRGPDTEGIPDIRHSEKIVLIDQTSNIRWFYSTDEQGIRDLLLAVSAL
jgi:protein SCO1/2